MQDCDDEPADWDLLRAAGRGDLLGHIWGVAVGHCGDPPTRFTACALLGGLLLLFDGLASRFFLSVEKRKERNPVIRMSMLYLAGLVVFEPFLVVRSIEAGVLAALVLIPVLLAIRYFVHVRAWISVAGMTLFLLASSAMLASNAHGGQSGFFVYWRS